MTARRIFNLDFGAVIILVLACLFAYGLMLSSDFKMLDDQMSIVENPLIRDVSGLKEIFSTSFFGDNHYYRPLVTASYLVEHQLFGLKPFYFNLNNLILHALTGVSVYFLLKLILGDALVALIAALLFVMHPINWEPVCNISGRSILLSTFFGVNAFLAFILADRREGVQKGLTWGLSVALFFLSMLAKESGIVLPAALLFYMLLLKENKRRAILKCGPFLLVALFYLIIRYRLGITEVYAWRSSHEALLGFFTFLRGSLTYLRLLIFPVDLHFDRARALFVSFKDPELILTVGAYSALFIAALLARKKMARVVLFLLFWVLVDFFPVSQIVAAVGVQPGYIALSEHFVYGPSIAIFALIALGVHRLAGHIIDRKLVTGNILKLAGAGIFAFLFLTTVKQAIVASQALSMIEQSLQENPHNARMNYSYALELTKVDDYGQVEIYFRNALKYQPDLALARIGLAKAMCDQGRCLEAMDEYKKVRHPGKFAALLQANLRLTRQLIIRRYREKIVADPDDPVNYYSLGVFYQKMDETDNALKMYERAVDIKPDYVEPLYNLAVTYDKQGDQFKAFGYYIKVIEQAEKANPLFHPVLNRVKELGLEMGEIPVYAP